MRRRALVACALFVVLGGPTPGAVGSCSGDGELEKLAELGPYCSEREELTCIRMSLRREITLEQRDDCRRCAVDFSGLSNARKMECLDPETAWNEDRRDPFVPCERRFWPSDCRPTVRQTSACLNALRSMDTLSTAEGDIEECNTAALCTVKPPSGPALFDGGMDEP